jgi:hypothetical protein
VDIKYRDAAMIRLNNSLPETLEVDSVPPHAIKQDVMFCRGFGLCE